MNDPCANVEPMLSSACGFAVGSSRATYNAAALSHRSNTVLGNNRLCYMASDDEWLGAPRSRDGPDQAVLALLRGQGVK